jgi:enolase
VPSGASTGEHETVELRDGGDAFGGRGVLRAVANVNREIANAVVGRDAADQEGLDRALIELDGTDTKSRLGANAILAVSLSVARARADHAGLPAWSYWRQGRSLPQLPMPMLNVLNGGVHADNPVDFQEYMIVPVGADTFSRALQMAVETYQHLVGGYVRLHEGDRFAGGCVGRVSRVGPGRFVGGCVGSIELGTHHAYRGARVPDAALGSGATRWRDESLEPVAA